MSRRRKEKWSSPLPSPLSYWFTFKNRISLCELWNPFSRLVLALYPSQVCWIVNTKRISLTIEPIIKKSAWGRSDAVALADISSLGYWMKAGLFGTLNCFRPRQTYIEVVWICSRAFLHRSADTAAPYMPLPHGSQLHYLPACVCILPKPPVSCGHCFI